MPFLLNKKNFYMQQVRFPQVFGMNLDSIIRSQCIDVPTVSGTGSAKFPDQAQLRNSRIVGLEILTQNSISQTPQLGKTLMTLANMQKTTVDLYEGDLQIVNDYPLISLNRTQNASNDPFVRDLFKLNNRILSWTKCTLNVEQGTWSADGWVPFTVYYYNIADLIRLYRAQQEASDALDLFISSGIVPDERQ